MLKVSRFTRKQSFGGPVNFLVDLFFDTINNGNFLSDMGLTKNSVVMDLLVFLQQSDKILEQLGFEDGPQKVETTFKNHGNVKSGRFNCGNVR